MPSTFVEIVCVPVRIASLLSCYGTNDATIKSTYNVSKEN
jgi:hypothetical protein